jgi:hypothetical protein
MFAPQTAKEAQMPYTADAFETFFEHVLPELYKARPDGNRKFIKIDQNALARILGAERHTRNFKAEVEEYAAENDIGAVHTGRSYIFFDLSEAEEDKLGLNITGLDRALAAQIEHLRRYAGSAAMVDEVDLYREKGKFKHLWD